MSKAKFDLEISTSDLIRFAEISGDWNPMHTDSEYAKNGPYKERILHGAYAAGLFSRLAGMYIPGQACLLRSMRLRFVAPITPPTEIRVSGTLSGENRVEVTISDRNTGRRYTEGSYEFTVREASEKRITQERLTKLTGNASGQDVLVTGATGGLGKAVLNKLDKRGIGLTRGLGGSRLLSLPQEGNLQDILGKRELSGIINCSWPKPDNTALLDIERPDELLNYNLTKPLSNCLALARYLVRNGKPGALLVLVGSTFSKPGRHGFKTPVYSIAKSVIETLTQILALELGRYDMRCVAIVFDVIDGGMNAGLDRATALAHADRVPSGELPSLSLAAEEIVWMLSNSNRLINGATINLTGGALP